MNNDNNQGPQLTPVPENNPQQVNAQPQNNVNTNTNRINSINPELNNKIINENGARIDTVSGNTPQIHTAAFESEHKKVEKKTGTHDGPSKGLSIILVLFFMLLLGFVFFLPDISDYMRQLTENKNIAEITTGKLICTYGRTSDKLNFDYTSTAEFKNKELFKYTIKQEVSGSTEDSKDLTKLYNDCLNLEKVSSSISGISINCNYLNTKFTQTEIFNYSEIGDDNSKTKIAYTEGGGTYPEFKYNENVDDVEVSLKQAGYTCEKIK